VRVLLDTHPFIWWLAGDMALSDRARQIIADPANEVFVSAASAWEIATQHRLGRLPEIAFLTADPATIIAGQGFTELAITYRHGQVAGGLAPLAANPFDRMLAAQAIVCDLPIVSNDTVFDAYGITRLW
jgi:PIN domain nuclease of toxin-antitoxin system